jgi:hypothetical protein
VFRKLIGLAAGVAAIAAATLILPAGAFACNSTSATCVYSPQGLPGGGHSSGGGGGGNSGGGGGTGQSQTPAPVSSHVASALSRAHVPPADKSVLQGLASNPAFGKTRGLTGITPESVVAPSTIGAAFDLGPGPIALIAVLAASALLLLGATGWRGWRRWRGPLGG